MAQSYSQSKSILPQTESLDQRQEGQNLDAPEFHSGDYKHIFRNRFYVFGKNIYIDH